VLAQGNHGPVHDPDPSPFRPGRLVGCGIDEYGRLTGTQQPVQPSLAEDVVGGDEQEQRLAQDLVLDCGQRRSVAICPSVGIDHVDAIAPEPADNRRDRAGVVADDDQDPLQPGGEERANGPLDQAQAAEAKQRLGAAPGDRGQPLGPARGQHHPHPRQPRRGRVGLDQRRRPVGGWGERVSGSLWCLSHVPAPLWQQGTRRGNYARITGHGRPGNTVPNRPTRRGRRLGQTEH
jgi:hypothetical protein